MKKTTRILCLMLAVALAASLCGCGSGEPENPNRVVIGDYEVLMQKAEIMPDYDGNDALVVTYTYTNNSKASASFLWTVFEKAFQNGVELETATIFVSATSYDTIVDSQMTEIDPGKSLEVRSAFVLNDAETPVELRFSDLLDKHTGKITVDVSKLEHVPPLDGGSGTTDEPIATDAPSVPNEPAASSEPAASGDALLDWWNGGWYGWWIVRTATGDYADLQGEWYDCAAYIDIGEDYTGTVELWDEDLPRADGLAYAEVTLSEDGLGEHGTLVSEDGWFLDFDLGHADWIIDPELEEDYDNMIDIDGWIESDNGDIGYTAYLRPWGMTWDDALADDLPEYYDEWYLPLIEAGESIPNYIYEMPEAAPEPTAEPTPEPAATPEPTEVPAATEAPAATEIPASVGNTVTKSSKVQEFLSKSFTTITVDVPAEGWWTKGDDEEVTVFYLVNTPEKTSFVNSGDPQMKFEIKGSEDIINTYSNIYENITEIAPRTIGGVQCVGRTYTRYTVPYTEYYGPMDNGLWLDICILELDVTPGSEADAILNSVRIG